MGLRKWGGAYKPGLRGWGETAVAEGVSTFRRDLRCDLMVWCGS